jgi:uncharacterized protein YjiS (DUF1127 family)
MSTFNEVTNIRPAINSRLGGYISGVSARFAQYRTYRRTLDELQSLTDRELSDLGISRHSVRAIAYRAAYDG